MIFANCIWSFRHPQPCALHDVCRIDRSNKNVISRPTRRNTTLKELLTLYKHDKLARPPGNTMISGVIFSILFCWTDTTQINNHRYSKTWKIHSIGAIDVSSHELMKTTIHGRNIDANCFLLLTNCTLVYFCMLINKLCAKFCIARI